MGIATQKKFYNNSSRELKTNIKSQYIQALQEIEKLKFYSYDFKNTEENSLNSNLSHVEIGLIADEAPNEIKSDNGNAIDLYAYISLTAKALQELSEKCTIQEKRIESLEAELQEIGRASCRERV